MNFVAWLKNFKNWLSLKSHLTVRLGRFMNGTCIKTGSKDFPEFGQGVGR